MRRPPARSRSPATPGSTAAATLRSKSIVSGMGSGLKNFLTGYRKQTDEERAISRLTQQKIEIVTNEGLTTAEATWLAEHIGRDGRMTPNEQALLMFLKADSGAIHPALRDLVKRASLAA